MSETRIQSPSIQQIIPSHLMQHHQRISPQRTIPNHPTSFTTAAPNIQNEYGQIQPFSSKPIAQAPQTLQQQQQQQPQQFLSPQPVQQQQPLQQPQIQQFPQQQQQPSQPIQQQQQPPFYLQSPQMQPQQIQQKQIAPPQRRQSGYASPPQAVPQIPYLNNPPQNQIVQLASAPQPQPQPQTILVRGNSPMNGSPVGNQMNRMLSPRNEVFVLRPEVPNQVPAQNQIGLLIQQNAPEQQQQQQQQQQFQQYIPQTQMVPAYVNVNQGNQPIYISQPVQQLSPQHTQKIQVIQGPPVLIDQNNTQRIAETFQMTPQQEENTQQVVVEKVRVVINETVVRELERKNTDLTTIVRDQQRTIREIQSSLNAKEFEANDAFARLLQLEHVNTQKTIIQDENNALKLQIEEWQKRYEALEATTKYSSFSNTSSSTDTYNVLNNLKIKQAENEALKATVRKLEVTVENESRLRSEVNRLYELVDLKTKIGEDWKNKFINADQVYAQKAAAGTATAGTSNNVSQLIGVQNNNNNGPQTKYQTADLFKPNKAGKLQERPVQFEQAATSYLDDIQARKQKARS